MRKSDKKIENQLRVALTEVCDVALKEIEGFLWLTHLVNYADFPKSLRVTCVFDTNDSLATYHANVSQSKVNENSLHSLIHNKITAMGVSIKSMSNHLEFDTEEDCMKTHNGNWKARLG